MEFWSWGSVALPAAVTGSVGVLSAGVAVAALWAAMARRSFLMATAAAAISLGVTITYPRTAGSRTAEWGVDQVPLLIEIPVLLILIVLVVRRAPIWQATFAGLAIGVALAAMVLRLISPPSFLAVVGACALWGLAAAGAATVGIYLRRQDDRRGNAVATTRQAERLQLARDLHDFVAHDISEMIAQAQAGQIVAPGSPQQALELFQRIEGAGQRAMASMDRTVHMLHDSEDQAVARTPQPGLAELEELTERFAAAGSARVELQLDRALTRDLPGEVTSTLYRTVVEALTNIRRHAPTAPRIAVTVGRTRGPAVVVTISNDRPQTPSHLNDGERRGGLGLTGLTQRVQALDGTLSAGPDDDGGWQVRLMLPLPPDSGAR